MRVLLESAYAVAAPRTGVGIYTGLLADALRAAGAEVELAAPRRAHRYTNVAAELAWQARLARRARGFDVLHHPQPALAPAGLCAVPQVVSVQDLAFVREPECFNGRFRMQAAFRHRRAARAAAVVVCASAATAADVRSRWGVAPERIVLAPFGPGQAPAGDRGAPGYFLYVGDDEPRKNLGRLLEAYGRYRDAADAPLGLVLAGAAAGRAGGDGVRGEPAPDLDALHRHAAALVIPSLHEGFGLPALEAMHAGTPVLAARTAGLAEVCAGAARWVDPRDTGSIAAGLTELATVPPLREELRRRGLARAAAFSWERCAQDHLRAYALATAFT